MSDFSHLQGSTFVCPICGAGRFDPVIVKRPGRGDWYHTAFFECSQCSVMFRDPKRFKKPGEVVALKPRGNH